MTPGERLQKAMEIKGLNAYQLAQKAGVPPISVSRLLRNERTHLEHATLTRLAIACGCRAEWLSLESGPMVDPPVPGRLWDRKEWKSVAARVRLAHREIHAEDVAAIGMLVDDGTWPARLDAPLVATMAAARRAWMTRAASPD
jgi:transcriptional regulator with XRE-family HTH domain